MDEGQSRRSVSPYHEKCFPPYCDNAQHVDKAMVAKMPREDLEDKYITFADENLELKKQNKNQDRQIQRLQTAIARQDKLDKRSGLTPASMVADQNKVAILEAQNKNLQSKIKVLKQQLMNHSYIHSKEGRISDAKTRQAKSSKDSDLQMPSQTQSAREAKPDRNVAALKMRVAELEDERPSAIASKETDNARTRQKKKLNDELNTDLRVQREVKPIADEYDRNDSARKRQNKKLSDELNTDAQEPWEMKPIADERPRNDDALRMKRKNKKLIDESNTDSQESGNVKPIADEHNRNDDALKRQNKKFIDELNTDSQESGGVKPTADEHNRNLNSLKTSDSERCLAVRKRLRDALLENQRLKQELAELERDSKSVLKRENEKLNDELNTALQELGEVKPIAEEHTRNCQHKERPREQSPTPSNVSKWKTVQSSIASKTKTPSRQALVPRQDHVSHVSFPPSDQCEEIVGPNDPAQKANMLIVSKHDFETTLTQKKQTSKELIGPGDGQQTLNCKLEVCVYDLDIEDNMLEYLSSIQPEPKLYVEWSFVGLDQRTAPMPAERALFYTNVMYYGPLSTEIKNYLNKVEMPVYVYLLRSSGPPLKVAEGSLDMLQAMEQPNRGFMRSVMLRGKDIPSRYALDKVVATIHWFFILHECCLGDPPFKDQVEVAIGTLYLKNRDGGVVPDHATHIYIEYALLGHCGPDLETDSIPRGEVMKFKHSKKLRVNDENEHHLKAMLDDNNPRPLRFTVLAEPCSLTSDTEVETVGHADVNLNEEMIKKDRDLVSSQVPVYSSEGEHLGTLSVTVLGINTLQQVYRGAQMTT